MPLNDKITAAIAEALNKVSSNETTADLDEQAKWRQQTNSPTGPGLGKTFVKTTVDYGDRIIKEPIGKEGLDSNSEPITFNDKLQDRADAKLNLSQKGLKLTRKNAQRNLKYNIQNTLGTHRVANLPESEEVSLDENVMIKAHNLLMQGHKVHSRLLGAVGEVTKVANGVAHITRPGVNKTTGVANLNNPDVNAVIVKGENGDYFIKHRQYAEEVELEESTSEWEIRHDEFVKAGEEATPEHIKDIQNKLKAAADKADSKKGIINSIFGKKSNGDLSREAYAASHYHKLLDQNKNAAHGTEDRKTLGQHLTYAKSLLSRMNESIELEEAWDDHFDPDDSISVSLGKNDAKYKAQNFPKGRVHKGTYGGSYSSDEEGNEVSDTQTKAATNVSLKKGDKVRISAEYGKANKANGIRASAPHQVISTTGTHAELKNMTKGTTHTVPLAHLSLIGKKGRPTTVSSGGDKSDSKFAKSDISSNAPAWMGMGTPLKSKVKAKKITFDESVDVDNNNIELEEATHVIHTVDSNGRQGPKIKVSAIDDKNAEYQANNIVGQKPYRGYKVFKVTSIKDQAKLDESLASMGRAAEKEWHDDMSGPSGGGKLKKFKLSHPVKGVISSHDTEREALDAWHNLPNQKGVKIMSEGYEFDPAKDMFDVELCAEGNSFKYVVKFGDVVVSEGVSATLSGAEARSDRVIDSLLEEVYSKDESKEVVLNLVKSIGRGV